MARFLSVDWDHSEVRFLYGTFSGDQLVLLHSGAEPINLSTEEPSSLSSEADSDGKMPAGEESDKTERDSDISSEQPDTRSFDNEDESESVLSDDEETAEPVPEKGKHSPKDKESIERGQALKRLLRKYKIPAGPVILTVPRDRVELLNLNLPKLTEAELPDIVKNQVLRDSATYIEGHPLDFIPLGTPKGGSQKLISASITRIELRHLKTFVSSAGRKLAKLELRLTALAEFVRAGKIPAEEPTLLVQEGNGEVNFVIFEQGLPIYFRTVQVGCGIAPEEQVKRLKTELFRTIQIGAGENPVTSVFLFGREGDYAELIDELGQQEISAEVLNPFQTEGIVLKCDTVPAAPALFAPLVGTLLAERDKKDRPILDLLHPRRKPEPPNYAVYFILFYVLLLLAFGYLWHWNKKDLAKKSAEIEQLNQQLGQLQGVYNQLLPQYTILDNTIKWEQYGVNVLDELRDILHRLPPSPDLLISRMAYNGLDPQFGMPVFILSAKITQPEVYMRFYRSMTADGTFGINSRGVVQVPAATDDSDEKSFVYNFTAVILCRRRAPNDYLKTLSKEIRDISNDKPEFYDDQMKVNQQRNPQQNQNQQAQEPSGSQDQQQTQAQTQPQEQNPSQTSEAQPQQVNQQ